MNLKLEQEGSNLRMSESKTDALPLGYAPTDSAQDCHITDTLFYAMKNIFSVTLFVPKCLI